MTADWREGGGEGGRRSGCDCRLEGGRGAGGAQAEGTAQQMGQIAK